MKNEITYQQFLNYVNRERNKWERKNIFESDWFKRVKAEDKHLAIKYAKRTECLNDFKKNISMYIKKDGLTKKQTEAKILDRILEQAQEKKNNIDGKDPKMIYSLLSLLDKDIAEQYRTANEDLFDNKSLYAKDMKDVLREEKKQLLPSYCHGKSPQSAKVEIFKRGRLKLDELINTLETNKKFIDNMKNKYSNCDELVSQLDNTHEIITMIKELPQKINKDKKDILSSIGGSRIEQTSNTFNLEKKDIDKVNKIMNSIIIDKKNTETINQSSRKLYFKTNYSIENTLSFQLFNKFLME